MILTLQSREDSDCSKVTISRVTRNGAQARACRVLVCELTNVGVVSSDCCKQLKFGFHTRLAQGLWRAGANSAPNLGGKTAKR
jgi:hypothetical protein